MINKDLPHFYSTYNKLRTHPTRGPSQPLQSSQSFKQSAFGRHRTYSTEPTYLCHCFQGILAFPVLSVSPFLKHYLAYKTTCVTSFMGIFYKALDTFL